MLIFLILPLLALAVCLLDMATGVHPVRGAHSGAISHELDSGVAATPAAAVIKQQSTFPSLTRSKQIERRFQELGTKVRPAGIIPVIVGLRVDFRLEGEIKPVVEPQMQGNAINQTRNQRVSGLQSDDPASLKRFEGLPHLAASIDAAGLAALRSSLQVLDIYEELTLCPALSQSLPLIGAPQASASSYTGADKVVAIIDSGVNKT